MTKAPWLARLSGTWLLWLVFIASLPLVTGKIRASDEIEHVAFLHSVVFDHDLEFGNEYEYFYRQDPQGLAGFKATFLDLNEPRTGRHRNFAPIGSAILWAPAYLLTHGALVIAGTLGASVAADGLSRPYSVAICLASAAYGFLGLLLIHRALRRYAGTAEPVATWTVLAVWFATPVLYYMTLAAAFGHACSLFTVSLLLYLWLRWREELTWPRALLLGVAGGLAGLVREQDVLFLIVPAADLALGALLRRDLARAIPRLALLATGAVTALAPQLLAYKAINGSFGPSTYVARKMNWASPHFFEVLLNPGHGLLVWSPILLIAVVGLIVLCVRRRQIVPTLLLLSLLAQVWISGAVESWHMAGAFGARRFLSSTFVFAWGLAFVLAALISRGRRWLGALVVVALVWWNLSLMAQFALRLINSEGSRQHLEWPRVALNQFTLVPSRAARAGYLFFADRARLEREIREKP
jgi:hypothetical protein